MQSYKELDTPENIFLEVQRDVLTQNILTTLEKGYSMFDTELVNLVDQSLETLKALEELK